MTWAGSKEEAWLSSPSPPPSPPASSVERRRREKSRTPRPKARKRSRPSGGMQPLRESEQRRVSVGPSQQARHGWPVDGSPCQLPLLDALRPHPASIARQISSIESSPLALLADQGHAIFSQGRACDRRGQVKQQRASARSASRPSAPGGMSRPVALGRPAEGSKAARPSEPDDLSLAPSVGSRHPSSSSLVPVDR